MNTLLCQNRVKRACVRLCAVRTLRARSSPRGGSGGPRVDFFPADMRVGTCTAGPCLHHTTLTPHMTSITPPENPAILLAVRTDKTLTSSHHFYHHHTTLPKVHTTLKNSGDLIGRNRVVCIPNSTPAPLDEDNPNRPRDTLSSTSGKCFHSRMQSDITVPGKMQTQKKTRTGRLPVSMEIHVEGSSLYTLMLKEHFVQFRW